MSEQKAYFQKSRILRTARVRYLRNHFYVLILLALNVTVKGNLGGSWGISKF